MPQQVRNNGGFTFTVQADGWHNFEIRIRVDDPHDDDILEASLTHSIGWLLAAFLAQVKDLAKLQFMAGIATGIDDCEIFSHIRELATMWSVMHDFTDCVTLTVDEELLLEYFPNPETDAYPYVIEARAEARRSLDKWKALVAKQKQEAVARIAATRAKYPRGDTYAAGAAETS